MIQKAKLYKNMGDLERKKFDILEKLNKFSEQKETENLAKTLVDTLNFIQEAKTE